MSMIRTNNKTETIKALWAVSKRESGCKDNHFFIGKNGEILGHGYLQGNGDYFPTHPKGAVGPDIVVHKGTKKKDIIEQIRTAMNEV